VRDFRLPPQYKWDLLSVGILLIEWQIRLSVSWQRTCPTFQGQAVQEELSFDFLTLETELLSCPETRYETIIIGCVKSQEKHRSHITLRLTVLTLTGRQGKLLRSCFATFTVMEHATLFVTIWTPLAIKLVNRRFKLDFLYLVLKGYFIKHLFKYSLSIPMQRNILLKTQSKSDYRFRSFTHTRISNLQPWISRTLFVSTEHSRLQR